MWAGTLMGWLLEKKNRWAARYNGRNDFGLAERIEISFFEFNFRFRIQIKRGSNIFK
jgi:hypothetical protein